MAEHRDAVRGDQRKDEGVEEVRQAGMTQKRCRLRILWHHRKSARTHNTTTPPRVLHNPSTDGRLRRSATARTARCCNWTTSGESVAASWHHTRMASHIPRGKQHEEVLAVSVPNAHPQPGAVVVEADHAVITHRAVMRKTRANDVASPAHVIARTTCGSTHGELRARDGTSCRQEADLPSGSSSFFEYSVSGRSLIIQSRGTMPGSERWVTARLQLSLRTRAGASVIAVPGTATHLRKSRSTQSTTGSRTRSLRWPRRAC